MPSLEANFDGLIGPTHNFGGLSLGNLASLANTGRFSNPRKAALQGIAKMRRLLNMGIIQGVLPPHERPHVPTLRRLGFRGTDHEVIRAAWNTDRSLVANVCSASAMWTANAATVSARSDTRDQRTHITPANLGSMFHRSLESAWTSRILKAIFSDEKRFAHHQPLPSSARFGDEGAANHNRLCPSHGEAGIEVFVYGQSAFAKKRIKRRFEPRQAKEASESIARLHELDHPRSVFVQQSVKAINAGAFHNDVVAVANETVLFAHEDAFESNRTWDLIRARCPFDIELIKVLNSEIPLRVAIKTYLFNSQLVTLPTEKKSMALILPEEVRENKCTFTFVNGLLGSSTPIKKIIFADVRESMGNGGGPACLRLRVVLDDPDRAAVGNVLLDRDRLSQLEQWVKKHYRDRLWAEDLGDPELLDEVRSALDQLTVILKLGTIYEFQSL